MTPLTISSKEPPAQMDMFGMEIRWEEGRMDGPTWDEPALPELLIFLVLTKIQFIANALINTLR